MSKNETELIDLIKQLRLKVWPYMENGIEEDWQEFIALTDKIYLLHTNKIINSLEDLRQKGAELTIPDKKGNHVPWWPNGFKQEIDDLIYQYSVRA